MNPIYLFFHIPRTGGTTIENVIGHWSTRTNDRFLKHYHYVQNYSERQYEESFIPNLIFRTTEQQKQMIIMTGHSIFCNSHKWLRTKKEPKIFSVIRNPIERCLSSFNYRHSVTKLCQDASQFSRSTPFMNENACHQQKTANDYDTLWDYYQDSTFETNIQSKWIVKSFLKRDGNTWFRHPTYVFGPDAGIPVEQAVPMTWPEWMFYPPANEDVDWYSLAENFFKEIWWLLPTENLDVDMPAFCQHAGLEYLGPKKENESKIKYWSLEDVLAQPDIDKLIDAEKYDFQLYEAAKNWKRPF
jgi:hypothetical protein